jgi:lipopolysaccharide/colanic/teichoic acid biosynthesis glycosyltransferase
MRAWFTASGSVGEPHASWATLEPVPPWKRILDLVVGSTALILLAPVMVLAAAAIAVTSRGPILFRQVRVGRGERPFMMLKFRTMRANAQTDDGRDALQNELSGSASPDPTTMLFRPSDDPRILPVGRFLRRFSIDELPQLWNVVRGDMSLVGPRPAPPSEVELFPPEQRERHRCPPGLTGLWQVSGRNLVSSREMLTLDMVYVRNRSLALDLRILLRTPRAVLVDRYTR